MTELKAYRDGTHRVAGPEATLARLLPKLALAGITRVADVTGLDTIGIPVVMSARPGSRTLSVQQGKGATLASAKVSAIMESIETFCAEQPRPDALCRPVRPSDLFPRHLLRRQPEAGEAISFVPGTDLATGETVHVPEELVTLDFTSTARPGHGWFTATSNGLASGNTIAEATLHALCEVIERAAVARLRQAPRAAQAAMRIDPHELADPNIATMMQLFAASAMTVEVWDVTLPLGIPAFQCCIDDCSSAPPFLGRFTGSGCHPDVGVALSRALSEAAQSRLTLIAGLRDDLGPEYYAGCGWQPSLASLIAAGEAGPARALSPIRARSCAGDTIDGDLAEVIARTAASGAGRIVCVDLTHPDLGEACVRVLAPGFDGGPAA